MANGDWKPPAVLTIDGAERLHGGQSSNFSNHVERIASKGLWRESDA